MTTLVSQCLTCRHFKEAGGDWTCAAFPEGIPDKIVLNRVDHREPVEGDNDIRWASSGAGEKHPVEEFSGSGL